MLLDAALSSFGCPSGPGTALGSACMSSRSPASTGAAAGAGRLGQAPEPTLQPGPGTPTGALVDIVFCIHWLFDQSAKRARHAKLSFVL